MTATIVFVFVGILLPWTHCSCIYGPENSSCSPGAENRTLLNGIMALRKLLVNRPCLSIHPFFIAVELVHELTGNSLKFFSPPHLSRQQTFNGVSQNLSIITTMNHYVHMIGQVLSSDEATHNSTSKAAVYSTVTDLVVQEACRYVSSFLITSNLHALSILFHYHFFIFFV